jgi:hypothetical protein
MLVIVVSADEFSLLRIMISFSSRYVELLVFDVKLLNNATPVVPHLSNLIIIS